VTVSSQIVKQLEDRGWIDAIGYREAPGRPALYATTKQFLDDLGLASLDQLPAIDVQTDAGQTADALAALQTAPLLEDQSDLVSDAASDAQAVVVAPAELAEAQISAEPGAAVALEDAPEDTPPLSDTPTDFPTDATTTHPHERT
jgi:segregation and condensation protein B